MNNPAFQQELWNVFCPSLSLVWNQEDHVRSGQGIGPSRTLGPKGGGCLACLRALLHLSDKIRFSMVGEVVNHFFVSQEYTLFV